MDSAALDTSSECIGYAASGLVLATFCFSNPVWLRLFALMSNVAFIAFGYMEAIHPVMLLHLALLPINAYHLAKLLPATAPILSPGLRKS
jgi:CRP/FNR family transcriptional regulator, cyclic AMP receptor protein